MRPVYFSQNSYFYISYVHSHIFVPPQNPFFAGRKAFLRRWAGMKPDKQEKIQKMKHIAADRGCSAGRTVVSLHQAWCFQLHPVVHRDQRTNADTAGRRGRDRAEDRQEAQGAHGGSPSG